jgi:hypothetical protein
LKGLKVGIGNGSLFAACFATCALGFWYGGILLAESVDEGCEQKMGTTCISGGAINAVFFAVFMGSIGMGQVWGTGQCNTLPNRGFGY